jgi:hypothetical protein
VASKAWELISLVFGIKIGVDYASIAKLWSVIKSLVYIICSHQQSVGVCGSKETLFVSKVLPGPACELCGKGCY